MDGEDGEREKEREEDDSGVEQILIGAVTILLFNIRGLWVSECVSLREWFDVFHLL